MGECILIDPVLETVDRDAKLVQELGLKLKFVVNTHVHADHVTGSGLLKHEKFASMGVKSAIGEQNKLIDAAMAKLQADVYLNEGDRVEFGDRWIEALETPGHTGGCLSYVLDDKSAIFTGDTLLIRGCGRTDFQSGNSSLLFSSVRNKIFSLPGDTVVFPAHDYQGRMSSTIAEEKTHNPRLGLGTTEEEFKEIMANLKLPYPKKIDVAVPANILCGIFEVDEETKMIRAPLASS